MLTEVTHFDDLHVVRELMCEYPATVSGMRTTQMRLFPAMSILLYLERALRSYFGTAELADDQFYFDSADGNANHHSARVCHCVGWVW
jgi:hypothetical protein